MATLWASLLLCFLTTVTFQMGTTEEASVNVGVCYGMNGNNLPSHDAVIKLYKHHGIRKMRLFDPNHGALDALRGSRIAVSLGVRNEDIPNMASSQHAANAWFAANVAPYIKDVAFKYISVGNEVVPGPFASSITPAMQNLRRVLDAHNLANIKVTTVLSTQPLATSYPPSAGSFSNDLLEIMAGILKFLSIHKSPLMINVYPYFAYSRDPANVHRDYALFTATSVVVQDGSFGYTNIFDAIVDAYIFAMEKVGVNDVGIVISESGWPSAGNGEFTTPTLAATYNRNFKQHMVKNSGTPKRPGAFIDAYIFAMFNENLKAAGEEQHFGLFNPDMQPAYPID